MANSTFDQLRTDRTPSEWLAAVRRRSGGQPLALLERLAGVVADSISTKSDYIALVTDLQSRLIPAGLVRPAIGSLDARHRPVATSEQIGGDFYDSFTRRDGSVDVVVGDVLGHGVESTQAAAQLRAAARAVFAGDERSPARIINRIADACVELPGCACAAIVVASVAVDGRHVTWARAGAMPPILTGPNARVLGGGGAPPLGVATCDVEDTYEIDLARGDGLLFFTDGLVERRHEGIDQGLSRVVEVARCDFDLDDLIDAANPPETQRDDLAVVRWSSAA